MPIVQIIVYSCLATWSFGDFNPHTLNAVSAYVAKHPGVCRADDPVLLQDGVSLSECQELGPLHVMSDWQKNNPDRTYLGAPCSERQPEIVMDSVKERMSEGER